MNFGYVKDTAGITKPINLDDIKIINVTSDSITIRYNLTGTTSIVDQLAFFISFNNTGDISTTQIESQFYKWLENALISTSPLKASLNSAMPQLEIVTAGLINTSGYRDATFLAAIDQATACAASPTAACIVESEAGAPPVGTLVLANPSANDYEPIADGKYALNVGAVDKYFVTLNGSRIVQITVCPLLLDFIWDPNEQASGVVDDANYITFGNRSDIASYYGGSSMGMYTGESTMSSCSTNLKSSTDRTWPSGLIYNGFLDATDGLGQLPAFGIQLANSNVNNWSGAQLYISQNYYLDPSSATWEIYNQDFWNQGYQWFGNGTNAPNNFYSANGVILFNMGVSGRVFLPAGTSLVGTAAFTGVQFINFNSSGLTTGIASSC